MGQPKSEVLFRPDETLLSRKILQLKTLFERVVVVASPQTDGSSIVESGVELFEDTLAYQGPLKAFAPVLSKLCEQTEAVFLTGCDFPFLSAQAIDLLWDELGQAEIAVYGEGQERSALVGIYRVSVKKTMETLLSAGENRLMRLLDECDTRSVSPLKLSAVDGDLRSLLNVNSPEDLFVARQLDQRNPWS